MSSPGQGGSLLASPGEKEEPDQLPASVAGVQAGDVVARG